MTIATHYKNSITSAPSTRAYQPLNKSTGKENNIYHNDYCNSNEHETLRDD
jgi:hypothetical protein